jgi:hypothetical protein
MTRLGVVLKMELEGQLNPIWSATLRERISLEDSSKSSRLFVFRVLLFFCGRPAIIQRSFARGLYNALVADQ